MKRRSGVSTFAAAMIAMLLAVGSAAPHGVRGSDTSDIPGIPLPSLAIGGEVGGATVDVVYSLQVEAGTSLLLTLRGAFGAELGLYVFGDDANSVSMSTPLASSARAGSDQSISIQFFESAKIYINVNGRNEDRAFSFQLIASVVVDRTPPVIRFAAADRVGAGDNVCARVEAFDRISGVQSVAVGVRGSVEPQIWRAFRGNQRYCTDLNLPEGRHALVVSVRNSLGLITTAGAGEITIDNQAPLAKLGSPVSGVILDPRGTLAFKFSEPIWFVGPRRFGVVATTQTGQILDGTIDVSEDRLRVRWSPDRAIPVGTVVVAMLGQIRDAAGNVTTPSEPHITARKKRTSLGLELVRVGPKRVTLRALGSQNLRGASVRVEVRSGRTWVPVRDLAILASGTEFTLQKLEWRQARIVWAGDELLHTSIAESPIFE